jgi:hypothetical protein
MRLTESSSEITAQPDGWPMQDKHANDNRS